MLPQSFFWVPGLGLRGRDVEVVFEIIHQLATTLVQEVCGSRRPIFDTAHDQCCSIEEGTERTNPGFVGRIERK